MGNAIITMRIMPESVEADLKKIEDEAMKLITAYSDERQKKVTITPIAFGLKAVDIMFMMDEKKGDTEPLEKELQEIPEVQSVEVIDVRRALG